MSLEIYKSIYSRLPEDLQKIIYEYYDHKYGFFYDEFKKIESFYNLDRFGFNNFHSINNKIVCPIKFEDTINILNCINEIPIVFKRLKGHTSSHIISSYNGKHIIERYRYINKKETCYISNGEFIIAMIYLLFIPKGGGMDGNNSPNCDFNAINISKIIIKHIKKRDIE
jgi:hypothetical protein